MRILQAGTQPGRHSSNSKSVRQAAKHILNRRWAATLLTFLWPDPRSQVAVRSTGLILIECHQQLLGTGVLHTLRWIAVRKRRALVQEFEGLRGMQCPNEVLVCTMDE